MWNGKSKAVTFSFDDGVLQDKRLIDILNKYNLKCTFNLNSSLLGNSSRHVYKDFDVDHTKVSPSDVKSVYQGHEVSAHTKTHPRLTLLDEKTIISEVEEDRLKLSELCGYEVIGMAYPCGGVNNDERVAEIIKNNTGVKYSRTITSTNNFELQDNLYRFNPTVYHMERNKAFSLAEEFINLKTETPKIFYIWGHSYELDYRSEKQMTWEYFEEFCKLISNKEDIFYGTNKEILLV